MKDFRLPGAILSDWVDLLTEEKFFVTIEPLIELSSGNVAVCSL